MEKVNFKRIILMLTISIVVIGFVIFSYLSWFEPPMFQTESWLFLWFVFVPWVIGLLLVVGFWWVFFHKRIFDAVKCIWVIAAIFVMTRLGYLIYSVDLDYLLLIKIAVYLPLMIFWLSTASYCLYISIASKRKPMIRVSLVINIFFIISLILSSRISNWSYFERHVSKYEMVVGTIASGKSDTSTNKEYKDVGRYVVERTPSLKIGFIWPGSFLSSWKGAVYDPSGEINKENEGKPIKAFNGKIVWCIPMSKPNWFLCGFD